MSSSREQPAYKRVKSTAKLKMDYDSLMEGICTEQQLGRQEERQSDTGGPLHSTTPKLRIAEATSIREQIAAAFI